MSKVGCCNVFQVCDRQSRNVSLSDETVSSPPTFPSNGCKVRRGVQPGSFIDLLMRAKDKTTGQGFTDLEIANQVTPFLLHTGEYLSLSLPYYQAGPPCIGI